MSIRLPLKICVRGTAFPATTVSFSRGIGDAARSGAAATGARSNSTWKIGLSQRGPAFAA